MKKFNFRISETFYKTIEVEANNADEALDIAFDVLGETSLSHEYICEGEYEVEYEGNVEAL